MYLTACERLRSAREADLKVHLRAFAGQGEDTSRAMEVLGESNRNR